MSAEFTENRLAYIAAAIAEPARSKILCALLDGKARTSTELSAIAEVSPATTSAHLQKLRDAHLLELKVQGRHRYYAIANREVAQALESLLVIVGKPEFKPTTPARLRQARTCYDHLAGSIAVALHDEFLKRAWLAESGNEYSLTTVGASALQDLGISTADYSKRRRFACACLDWSERRPHLGGALGAALLDWMEQQSWLERDAEGRAVMFTLKGKRKLVQHFAVSGD